MMKFGYFQSALRGSCWSIVRAFNYRLTDAMLAQLTRGNTMAMSKDRIRFFLPERYFSNSNNGMSHDRCLQVLSKANGIANSSAPKLMRANPSGFTIMCRPSQFARFIFYRDKLGKCINGIRDLRLELIDKPDVYDDIAADTGLSRENVKSVACALGYSDGPNGPLPSAFKPPHQIDVSNRNSCGED